MMLLVASIFWHDSCIMLMSYDLTTLEPREKQGNPTRTPIYSLKCIGILKGREAIILFTNKEEYSSFHSHQNLKKNTLYFPKTTAGTSHPPPPKKKTYIIWYTRSDFFLFQKNSGPWKTHSWVVGCFFREGSLEGSLSWRIIPVSILRSPLWS